MDERTHSIVSLLKRDHEHVAQLFALLESTASGDLEAYFCEVREKLVRHEVVEELIVYPAFRKAVPGGDAIADSCIAEQAKAEEMLAAMEHRDDRGSPSLRGQLVELRQAVLKHAAHEERDVLPALEAHEGHPELAGLGDLYEGALLAAPTHPHPHAPDSPPGNFIFSSISSTIDTVRDAMEAQRRQRDFRADEPMQSTDP